jgi:rieske iron-sulfur protein
MTDRTPPCCGDATGAPRRAVLAGVLGLGCTLPFGRRLTAAEAAAPKSARPEAGDRFVFALGDRKGETVAPDDLALGGPQVLVWPMEPASGVVRNGSRLNQVALVRLDAGTLAADVRANAAEGVVAYSAVCTHQGCPVSMWKEGMLFCSCHGSQFDPKAAAEVIRGPAKKRLAMLPLKLENGTLAAAGGFTGRVGFK